MTTQAFQVESPAQFDFSTPTEWPRWKQRFNQFRNISGLATKDESAQVEMLMYLMGYKANDIFRTFKFAKTDDKDKIDPVLLKFDEHFGAKKNVIFERFRFNTRKQEDKEPVEEFITDLYKLAEHCEFRDLHDEMIRDRIVCGVRNKQLSEKLQLDTTQTMEKAISMARQSESVKQQQQELLGALSSPKVQRVGGKSFQKSASKEKPAKTKTEDKSSSECGKCGFSHWKGKPCPAKDETCRNCGNKGHFAKCCKSKGKPAEKKDARAENVNTADDEEEDYSFLFAVHSKTETKTEREKRWSETINDNNKNVDFRLDTGAEIICIPLMNYRKLFKKTPLELPDRRIKTADSSNMECVGMFEATCKHKNKEVKDFVYVIRGLEKPLLSVTACEDLGLVKRVQRVRDNDSLSSVEPTVEFPELFQGIGEVGSPYRIKVKDGATPYAVHTARRIPIPLREKLRARLDELLKMGIIAEVNEPTDWCAPAVITAKPNGDIRLCVDLSKLNKNLDRELHPMPVVEHVLGQMGGAKIFSKLDANSGFHQIRLTEDSQLLTTFVTPFGRFCFRRLPFGITTAPELYQKTMEVILRDVEGVICYFDDILIHAATVEKHDEILREVLTKLKKAKVTLNPAKCVFGRKEINFLGHIVNGDGIKPDPKKINAVVDMPQPKNVTDVRRFMGFVNHLGRFIPHLAEEAAPLNQLLRTDQEFIWGPTQERSFKMLKQALSRHPTLAVYDVTKKITVSSDASSFGLGSVVKMETEDGAWQPIAYASRTMTDAEKRYAQIEKEAPALTWACERFQDFLVGKEFKIETDHKPLVPIFSTKDMDTLTPRLQRFRMRMLRFSFEIFHTPGKDLIAADTLSRQPLPTSEGAENEKDVAAHISAVLSCLETTDERIAEIFKAQQEDNTMKKLSEYSVRGWPEKKNLEPSCLPFWSSRDEIANENGILMKGNRLVIPASLQCDILMKIHAGHMGITRCRARARDNVWWPGISKEIEDMIRKCNVCVQETTPRHEPLMPTDFPTRPWQKLGMDLCYFEGKWYLVVVDYYSRYPEVAQLQHLTASLVVNVCKSIFARHGVPELVMTDNGTQFGDPVRCFHPGASREFLKFAKDYGFTHKTSSPKFAQSNGMAEAAVKIVKRLFKKNKDPSLALMEYRATPLQNGFSPAELLMGRKIRTTMPTAIQNLNPKTVPSDELRGKEKKEKEKQKKNYDRHHGVKEKEELRVGDTVWITDMKTWGRVTEKAPTPRSFIVETPRGTVRRNTFHLVKGSDRELDEPEDFPDVIPPEDRTEQVVPQPAPDRQPRPPPDQDRKRTRSGRAYRART